VHGKTLSHTCLPNTNPNAITNTNSSPNPNYNTQQTHTHTHNRFTAFLEYVRDHPGEQVPER